MIRYMEIDDTSSPFEIEVRIYDLFSRRVLVRHFHMRGTNNTYLSVLEFCQSKAHEYGVEEIRIYGVGGHAYDYMMKHRHTADPWYRSINRYGISKLA